MSAKWRDGETFTQGFDRIHAEGVALIAKDELVRYIRDTKEDIRIAVYLGNLTLAGNLKVALATAEKDLEATDQNVRNASHAFTGLPGGSKL